MTASPAPAAELAAGLNLDDHLPYRLSVAANAVSGLIARAYQDRFGLTTPQWRLICVLAQDGAMTRPQLVARTVMDKVTVSRAAQGLVKRRLATLSAHHGDARLLILAEAGERLYAEIAPLAQAYEDALIASLRPEDVLLLKRLLGRLQTAAETLDGKAEPPYWLAG
jgi:DNA-binding MarR family transcriptional regulator